MNINGYPVNDVVLEGVMLMSNDQLKLSRHYRDIAFEAVLNPSGKSKMVQKLYTDIISKSNIDYGKIPLSKGDITKYEYYDNLIKCIENLNALLEGQNIEELNLTNKLHDMIITCRGDFEFGFKFDIEFIKLTYNTMVMTLHEMVNLCIVAYVDFLKEVKQVEFKFNTFKKNDRIIIKSTRDFLKSYEKGEWTKLMMHFKKKSSNFIGGVIPSVTAILPGAVVVAAEVVLATIAVLFTIRVLVYFYFSSAMKVNQYIKVQSEFLRISIENSADTTSTSLEKQKNMLSKLDTISSFIETKVLKTEKDTRKEIKESNATSFTLDELKGVSDTTGIELL